MVVAKLEPSQRKKGRWLVWFEDGSLLRAGEGDVAALALYAGKELTDQEYETLAAAGARSMMLDKAYNLLSYRPMSRKELLQKLTERPRPRRSPPRKQNRWTAGTQAGERMGERTGESRRTPEQEQEPEPEPDPDEVELRQEEQLRLAEQVADRLEELGLLNDAEYAKAVVQHYAEKGYGDRKLRDELYRRGVPREYWEDALAELPREEELEDSKIYQLARQKLRDKEPSRENLKKVSDYLLRRGFGWSEISEVLDRIRSEEDTDE